MGYEPAPAKWRHEVALRQGDRISKVDLARYKENSNSGLILEVDLEYSEKLHNSRNDYPLDPEQLLVEDEILSHYCKQIKNNLYLSTEGVRKLQGV